MCDTSHRHKCDPVATRDDKTAFCLGEKQGMLVNGECSSWYNRVGDFLKYQFGIRAKKFFVMAMDWHARHNRTTPTPECMVNGIEC